MDSQRAHKILQDLPDPENWAGRLWLDIYKEIQENRKDKMALKPYVYYPLYKPGKQMEMYELGYTTHKLPEEMSPTELEFITLRESQCRDTLD
jgi:hypothetical protein